MNSGLGKPLYILLIFISGTIAVTLDFFDNHALYQYFKPLTTVLILVLPVIFWNANNGKYNYLILTAMVFCLIGDIFLLKDQNFVLGLGSFLIAHLIFTTSFISLYGFSRHLKPLVVLVIIAGWFFITIQPHLGSFIIPVLVYASAIVLMSWQAVCLYVNHPKTVYILIAVGALLFLFSDAVIAYDKFKYAFNQSGLLILPSYWMAIFLFSYSTQLIPEKRSR